MTTIDHKTQTFIETQEQELTLLAANSKNITISDDATYEVAAQMVVAYNDREKQIEEERTKITKPMLDAKKAIDDFFKRASNPLNLARKPIQAAMSRYIQTKNEERMRLEAAASKAAQSGDGVVARALMTKAGVSNAPVASGVRVSETCGVAVVDASKIDRRFLALDESAVKAAAKADRALGLDPMTLPQYAGLLVTFTPQVGPTGKK